MDGMMSHVEEIDEGGIWEASRGKAKVKGLVQLWEVMILIMEVGSTSHAVQG